MELQNISIFKSLFSAPYWDHVFLGNTLEAYILAVIGFIILAIVFKMVQFILLSYFKRLALRTETKLDDTFIRIIKNVKPPFYFFLALYLAVYAFLTLSPIVQQIFNAVLIIWIVYEAIYAVQVLVEFFVKNFLVKDNDAGAESMAYMLGVIVKVVLWAFGVVIILGNIGFDVTSLIAGLGVAGIAVGLALQPVLADLFAAFSLYFDKPFRVGDFIGVGGDYGTVKYIGIKSTRIESYSGEQLVLANSNLASADIRNYSIRQQRHVVFTFGIKRETPLAKVRTISENLRAIIEKEENVSSVERAWFKENDESAYVFEAAYYMDPPAYSDYLDLQEKINLALAQWLEKEDIHLAYPTRTLDYGDSGAPTASVK